MGAGIDSKLLALVRTDTLTSAMATRKLTLGERDVVGEDIGFRITGDGAVTLELDDGAELRLRHVVFNVIRTEDKTPEGEPVYLVQSVSHVILAKPAERGD